MQRLISFFLSVLTFLFPFLSCGGGYEAVSGEKFTSPFYGEAENGRDMTGLFNGVHALFGGTDTEHSLVYRFGNEAAYYDWMAKKIMWTGDTAYASELKAKITGYPQTDNGYLWSWSTSTYWPTGSGNMHYDGIFTYISAVNEIISWENSTDFLFVKDADSVGDDTALDASRGRTVYEKCALAMDYALNILDGKNGVITIKENSVFLADGVSRFDKNENGEYVWNNTGLEGSASSNYWDNFCFGNKDAYETVLFYNAVTAMESIEKALGNAEKAAGYAALSEKIRVSFDETFWDDAKGRYIGCIDVNGVKHDLGFTFLNTMALEAGLGDKQKADRIFSWLDGSRKIKGDTSTGKDITDYSAFINNIAGFGSVRTRYAFVPRSTTVSVDAQKTKNGTWWESLNGTIDASKNGNAAYGAHLENGGYIFWTVYYELASYARFGYTDKLLSRVNDLKKVYDFNGFDSDLGTWAEGLIGEFPENGIVSRVYVTDILGFNAEDGALNISPALPDGYSLLGTQKLYFGGNTFAAEVTENSVRLVSESEIKPFDVLFNAGKAGTIRVELYNADGVSISSGKYAANGKDGVRLSLFAPGARSVVITY